MTMKMIDGRYRPQTPPVFAVWDGPVTDTELRKTGFPGLVKCETLEEAMKPAFEAGVEQVVFTGRDSGYGAYDNDYVADVMHQMPEHIIGVGGVDALDPVHALDKINHIHELGLKGISMDPAVQNIAANDARLYPIYQRCVELDLPVFLTVGPMPVASPVLYSYLEYASPLYIDKLAQDFPQLRIVASHGGFPFTQEWIATAWRNDNVYFETSIYWDQAGVAPLLAHAANQIIGDKIIFASGFPACPVQYTIDTIMSYGIKEEILPYIFHKNIERVLKLA